MIKKSDILSMKEGDQIQASEEVDIVRVKEGWLYSITDASNNYDVVMVPNSHNIASGEMLRFIECHENVDVLIVPGGKIYGMWYVIYDDARESFINMVKTLGGSMKGSRFQARIFSKIINYLEHSEAENVRRHVFVRTE